MASPQINIYVTQDERETFDVYARSLGLDVGSLANLILRRGLRRRLALASAHQSPMDSGAAKMKITVHDSVGDVRSRLEAAAAAQALSLSAAGAVLLRRELEERWLERAINHDDSE